MDDQTRDKLRQLLNLTPAEHLEALARADLEPEEVGHGLVAGSTARHRPADTFEFPPRPMVSYSRDPREALREYGPLELIPLHTPGPLALQVARSARNPSRLFVEAAATAMAVLGEWTCSVDVWTCDVGEGPAALRWRTTDGDVVVLLEPHAVEVYKVVVGPEPTSRPADKAALPSLPEVPMPPVDELLEGLPTPAWLADQAHELAASDAPLDRLAALGLVGRLWEPPSREPPTSGAAQATPARDLFDRLVRGELPSPARISRAWCEAHFSASLAAELEPLALDEADRLSELLETAELAVSEERGSAAALVRALALGRDDLASVEFALRASGRGKLLTDALATLDLHAEASLTTLRLVAPLEDERLQAVAWQDPDAWWGLLTGDTGGDTDDDTA